MAATSPNNLHCYTTDLYALDCCLRRSRRFASAGVGCKGHERTRGTPHFRSASHWNGIVGVVIHCVAQVHRKDTQSTMMSGYSNPVYSRSKILCVSCLQSCNYKHILLDVVSSLGLVRLHQGGWLVEGTCFGHPLPNHIPLSPPRVDSALPVTAIPKPDGDSYYYGYLATIMVTSTTKLHCN